MRFLTDLSVILIHHLWKLRKQKHGESINHYVLTVKRFSVHCNFVLNPRVSEAAHKSDNLTFDGACRVASAIEMASRQAQEVNPVSPVHKLSGKPVLTSKSPKTPVSCFRCGKGHYASNCPYKEVVCNKCNKVGHFARFCKSTDKSGSSHSKPSRKEGKIPRKQPKSVKCVSESESVCTRKQKNVFFIYCVAPGKNSKYGYFEFVQIRLND